MTNTFSVSFIIVLLCTALLLIIGTVVFSWLKSLQKTRYPHWTFLDYISVGYARHLYLKYILRK
jgi:hypothetical protein